MLNHKICSLTALTILTLFVSGCSTTPDKRLSVIESQVRAAESLGDEIQSWSEGLGTVPPSGARASVVAFQERADELQDTLDDVEADETGLHSLEDLEESLRSLSTFEPDNDELVTPADRRKMIRRFALLGEQLKTAAEQARYALL